MWLDRVLNPGDILGRRWVDVCWWGARATFFFCRIFTNQIIFFLECTGNETDVADL